MNILLSTIGRRNYLAQYFKEVGGDVKVFGTSNSQYTVGFNKCDKSFILPSIKGENYVPQLLDICKKNNVDAVLSLFDQDIEILSNYKDDFSSIGCVPIIAPKETSKICFDKYETFLFCKENQIGTPKTYLSYSNFEADLDSGNVSFPVVVKPRYGFGSANIFIAENRDKCEFFFMNFDHMIIQEFCKGIEHSFDMLFNLQGEHIRSYCKKKIQMRAGETDKAVTVFDHKLLSFSKKLGSIIKHVGPCDFDFFYDQENEPKILEINPRFGGGYPISHRVGADFPKLICDLVSGKELDFKLIEYQRDVLMMKEIEFYFNEL